MTKVPVASFFLCCFSICLCADTANGQNTVTHTYDMHLAFNVNNSTGFYPLNLKAYTCKGDEIILDIDNAWDPTATGPQSIFLVDRHMSDLTNCTTWHCEVSGELTPVITGDGIQSVVLNRDSCGSQSGGHIRVIVKPTASTTIHFNWTATHLNDAIPPGLCIGLINGAPAEKFVFNYSGEFEIVVKDPQPPTLESETFDINYQSGPGEIKAHFPADETNNYIDWYQTICGVEALVLHRPIYSPGLTESVFPVHPDELGIFKVRARLSQVRDDCLSDYSASIKIRVKPCALILTTGCNQDIVNEVEYNSCTTAAASSPNHHLYETQKEVCSGTQCNIDEYWQRYKSNLTNQVIVPTDQLPFSGGSDIQQLRVLFPESPTDGEIPTNCKVLYLPNILAMALRLNSAPAMAIGGYVLGISPGQHYDPVFLRIDETKKCVINYTMPGHILYPGKVTRCLVQECDQIKIITFGEGTSFLPGQLGNFVGWVNQNYGQYMFENVDIRAAENLNSPLGPIVLPPVLNSTSTPVSIASLPNLVGKTWEIKEFQVKYDNNDTLYTRFTPTDTINFWNMGQVNMRCYGNGTYHAVNVLGDSVQGTWLLDSAQGRLMLDSAWIQLSNDASSAFTVTGRVPVFADTVLTSAQYFLSFREQTFNWTGTESTAWENPRNWSSNKVPHKYSDVTIKDVTPFDPVINVPTKVRSLTVTNHRLITVNNNLQLAGP